ncbi:MAG: hypothetical protein HOI47_31730 [Candidatus Scalindua sp.]|jgi:hypothetical protein|nr:hypothetical protein [Candidatus Scalindua sp.]MBT6231234.1 hypothetical protein [Candidatus Scalindua sp.]
MKNPFLKKSLLIIGVLLCIPILAYLLLLGSSKVYVSGGFASDMFANVSSNPVWGTIENANVSWLPKPGPIHVERVGAVHALRNTLFILCTAALFALLPLICLVFGVIMLIGGLFTANWDYFLGGALCAVLMTPLSILGAVLGIFALWLGLLIQPCTPGYVILWIILGLPFMALGAVGGAAPTVIVIVKP